MTTVPPDIDDAPPTLGRCTHCAWQYMFPTVFAKQKGEEKHAERWHGIQPIEADEISDRLVDEHPADFAVVVRVIEACAVVNRGLVDQNVVRDMLAREQIVPQVVGPTYSRLKKQGRLVPAGENISTDKKGRNAGKKQTVYRLLDPSEVRA